MAPIYKLKSIVLRTVKMQDLKLGDFIVLDEKFIARVVHKGRTFLHDHPYIKVAYTVHYHGDRTDEDNFESVENEKRTLTYSDTGTVTQIVRVGIDDV